MIPIVLSDVLPFLNFTAICALIVATSIVAYHKRQIEVNQLALNSRLDHILMIITDLPTRKQTIEILEETKPLNPGATSSEGTSRS